MHHEGETGSEGHPRMNAPLRIAPRALVGALIAAAAAAAPSAAQTTDADLRLAALQDPVVGGVGTPIEEKWRLEVEARLWMSGLLRDFTARDLDGTLSADFIEVLEESDSVFTWSGRIEAGKGKWGGFIDVYYGDLGAEGQDGPFALLVDVDFEITTIDFGVMYRVSDYPPGSQAGLNRRNNTLDLYAGLRYTEVDAFALIDTFDARTYKADWLDPIVGAKVVAPISERWHFEGMADIGGFGFESNLSWSATAAFGYDCNLMGMPATLKLGYRVISHDYSEGSGANRFKWEVVQHGPTIGFSLLF
jgi:hypothetical protein